MFRFTPSGIFIRCIVYEINIYKCLYGFFYLPRATLSDKTPNEKYSLVFSWLGVCIAYSRKNS